MSTDYGKRELDKMAIALLEHLVKPAIGEDFIEEAKKPVLEKELRGALGRALSSTQGRFIAEHDNTALVEGLLQLPIDDLPSIEDAVRDFYERPTGSQFALILQERLAEDFSHETEQEISAAVITFIEILREELINVDAEIRDKLATQALLRIAQLLGVLPTQAVSKQTKRVGSLPHLPDLDTFVGREEHLAILKDRIGVTSGKSQYSLTIMRGWPGVGKTTLSTVLAYQDDVARSFTDGIFWTSLGEQPTLMTELDKWARAIGITDLRETAPTVEEAVERLSNIFRNKKALLIIDDVYEFEHGAPFTQIRGENCVALFTTRFPKIATQLASIPDRDIYKLPVLTDKKALELLALLAPSIVEDHLEAARLLVQELEGLPLALQVAGRLLFMEKEAGLKAEDLLEELRDTTVIIGADAPKDRIELANETKPTIALLLKKSTDRLSQDDRLHFAFLGVFAPKPATFDIDALKSVWAVDDPSPTVRELVNRGLLEYQKETERYQMHSLLVKHAQSLLEEADSDT